MPHSSWDFSLTTDAGSCTGGWECRRKATNRGVSTHRCFHPKIGGTILCFLGAVIFSYQKLGFFVPPKSSICFCNRVWNLEALFSPSILGVFPLFLETPIYLTCGPHPGCYRDHQDHYIFSRGSHEKTHKPSFPTVTGRGPHPTYTHTIHGTGIFTDP